MVGCGGAAFRADRTAFLQPRRPSQPANVCHLRLLMRYWIVHETLYRYASPVVLSHQLLHLTPRVLPWQTLHSHRIDIEAQPAEQTERADDFGNAARQVLIATPHQTRSVPAQSEAR